MNLSLCVIAGSSETEIEPSCASKAPTCWSETSCVCPSASLKLGNINTHTQQRPMHIQCLPVQMAALWRAFRSAITAIWKWLSFFPHYFWSERETEMPAGVWESDRRPRRLEHTAFKRTASASARTKARDQREIPSGERLLYMHWATVTEKSSGEGNQMALGRGKWQTQDEPCSLCPFCF